MSYRIGIYGSAITDTDENRRRAEALGGAIAGRGWSVVTGACSGLPYAAASAASRTGAEVWGFSPVRNIEAQRRFTPHDDLDIYSRLIYVSEDFPSGDLDVAKKYRNVLSTSCCDAGIIIAGKWGTLHEVCSLIDYGRVVGVLIGSGGIADELPALVDRLGIDDRSAVIFRSDPEGLVDEIATALERRPR